MPKHTKGSDGKARARGLAARVTQACPSVSVEVLPSRGVMFEIVQRSTIGKCLIRQLFKGKCYVGMRTILSKDYTAAEPWFQHPRLIHGSAVETNRGRLPARISMRIITLACPARPSCEPMESASAGWAPTAKSDSIMSALIACPWRAFGLAHVTLARGWGDPCQHPAMHR